MHSLQRKGAGLTGIGSGKRHVFVLQVCLDQGNSLSVCCAPSSSPLILNILGCTGVQQAYILWRNDDDANNFDEWCEARVVTVSVAGAWALFVQPALRRTTHVPRDANEALGIRLVWTKS